MDGHSTSVYNLIGDLCTALHKESNSVENLPPKILSNYRKKSFEILLKSKTSLPAEQIKSQLRLQLFKLHIKDKQQDAEELESQLLVLENEKNLFNFVEPMIELLLELKDSPTSRFNRDLKAPFLGCFPQLQSGETPQPYPVFHGELFELPAHLEGVFNRNNQTYNPYILASNEHYFSNVMSEMMVAENQGSQLAIEGNFTFFSDSNIVLGIESGNFAQMKPLNANRNRPQTLSLQPNPDDEMEKQAKKLLKRVQYGQAWEFLGHKAVLTELPFITDSVHDSMLHLLVQKENAVYRKFQAKVVPLDRFLEDLRLLTTGIQSESFKCNNLVVFEMQPDLTIPGVAPGALLVSVREFIECGTCFKRLKLMIQRNPYDLKLAFDGFVFSALCTCIEKFLATFRLFVSSFQDETVLELSSRISSIRKQLIALSRIVKIHPDVNNDATMPIGSEFLGYLYKEIVQLTQHDISMFLMFILKYCCHIYFSNFQKWIFNGYLQDEHKELFVYFVDHYRTKTKHFFDKAYLIRKQAVPGFLQGYEEDILLCGKYTMLLKEFKPEHPLFTLPTQSITVCLSYAQINQLRSISSAYIAQAIAVCGQPVTVKQLFQQRQHAKEEFYRCAETSSRINIEKWRLEQQEMAEELAKRRTALREELQKQLAENEANKLALRKAELELNQADMRNAQEYEDRLLMRENEARQKTIEHYQELEKIIDEKRAMTDKVIAGLQAEIEENNEALEKRNSVMAMSVGSDYFSVGEEDREEDEEEKACSPEDEINDNVITAPSKLKKSASDTFNANTEEAHTEFLKNRGRVLRSTLSEMMFKQEDWENCNVDKVASVTTLTDAQRNKLKVLSQEYQMGGETVADGVNNNVVNELTDLQKNRLKVLGQTNKVVVRRSSSEELSQLQRNRNRVLTQDFGMAVELKTKPELSLDFEETARARNKRKVLHSEYNILTGAAVGQATPSSAEEEEAKEKTILELSAGEPQVLKLDTQSAREFFGPETAMADATPFAALNTAGQQAKDGFAFPVASSSQESLPRRNTLEVEYKMPGFTTMNPLCTQLMDVISRRQNNFFNLGHHERDFNSFNKGEKLTKSPEDEELESLDSTTLTRFLQMSVVIPLNAHMEVINNEIMKMFLLDLQILDHFKSLRNYFFLMDGEFGSHICDRLLRKLETDACRPDELLKYHTLHAILDAALASSINTDKNAERLSFIVQHVPEKFELKSPDVLNMLALSYHVQWPLNLILNPETVEQYTKMFKYLVKVRRISWVMEQSFQVLKELHKQHGKEILLSPQYRHVQQIRHKLAHFMQALQNHITRTALQGSWKTFKVDLEAVRSMEDLYRKHTSYIKKILFLCMLNRRSMEFHNNVEDIFKVVLKFYRYLKAKSWTKKPNASIFVHPNYYKLLQVEQDFEKLIKYTVYLGNKIVLHGYQQEIGEFVNLININGYYDNNIASHN